MKTLKLLLLYMIVALSVYAQSYNSEKISLTKFLTRMYNESPFEGVRIVDDYNSTYLISVLALDRNKYKTETALNRVASVKAMAQASRYINGSTISQEMIIHTREQSNGKSDTEIMETIRESSFGHLKSLELLTNFSGQNNMQVYIFLKKLEERR